MSRCPPALSNVQRIAGYLDRRDGSSDLSLDMLICGRRILQSILWHCCWDESDSDSPNLDSIQFVDNELVQFFGALCVHAHVKSMLSVPVNAGRYLNYTVGCFGVLPVFHREAIDLFVASM